MGGCAGCCGNASDEESKKFTKGGDRDLSSGPAKNRGCTDCWCILLYLFSWAAFSFVIFLGVQDGNPMRLVKPRDYQGAYCGVETQWNGGPNLKNVEMLTYNMNVTSTVKMVADQMMCSSAVTDALTVISRNSPAVFSPADLDAYLCACCKNPCSNCDGSLEVQDLTNPSNLASVVQSRMFELTSTSMDGNSLFSATGANGDFFSSIWDQAAKYFVQVCTKQCSNLDNTTLTRTYLYQPPPDDPLSKAWGTIASDSSVPAAIRDTINNQFTFKALSFEDCPYDAGKCVPMPGVGLEELANGYCSFQLAAAVVNTVGSGAADAMANTGLVDLASSTKETFGEWIGDVEKSLDVLAITCAFAFVIGIIFLVALRFIIGWVVWISILLILFLLLASGGLFYVRSGQCAGTSLLDSGTQQAQAVKVVAQTTAMNAVNGVQGPSEEMTGNGADYLGAQTRTRNGKLCQEWSSQSPHVHAFNSSTYPNANLTSNYCRNPADADSIWCFTTDANMRWELCSPIGVIQPDCPRGYEVSSEDTRNVLKVVGYVMFGLAGVWAIFIICICSRIRLAIGVNKVAARFMVDNITIIFVPIIQAALAIVWSLLWVGLTTFLLSQVPDDYTPQGAYATYAEAYGTDTEPGACTNKAISGFVYKDDGTHPKTECTGANPLCWRCAPPRYIIDDRVAVSFFHFLWTNCFLVAFGQMVIAGAVGVWFFTKVSEKRKAKCVRTGWWNVIRYHTGTVLFGAFIIAVCQFIRACLKYLEAQAKAQKNVVMVWVLRCLQCVMWCWEKCMKFLNKNAYIQCALLGTNFCISAKAAFFLIVRNFIRFGAVAALTGAVEYIGVLCITIATGVAGYMMLRAMEPDANPILPVILYVGFGYVVAKLYMNVFGMAVSASLQCFIATDEMGGDKQGENSFVPDELKWLIGKQGSDGKDKVEEIDGKGSGTD